jgi:hypothetical protein
LDGQGSSAKSNQARTAITVEENQMHSKRVLIGAVFATLVALPLVGWANKGDKNDNKNKPVATTDAAVDFGVLPLAPLGSAADGCAQVAPFGGPADPCAYKLHHLTPEEVTIKKGGLVTFQVHGGGHAPAIYEVSKNTTRNDLGQFLCAGTDPEHAATPAAHPCPVGNPNAAHVILDGKGDIVIVAEANPVGLNAARVSFEPGRLMSNGGIQFSNGGTIAAGPGSNGELVSYRFLKNGRYLVMCMNRAHFLNDWMFGFVNVVGGGDDN